MISRYEVFCKVIENHSFTKTAEELGYTQSAVSQTVKKMEDEIGSTLIERSIDRIVLTKDGEQMYPFIRDIYSAEKAYEEKKKELIGLGKSKISIGTFTSVSRTFLPKLMSEFRENYPAVDFELYQGEYDSISEFVKEGKVDFGFVDTTAVPEAGQNVLYTDRMMAILPLNHPQNAASKIRLRDLRSEPFILLDEGRYSITLKAFEKEQITPNVRYKVSDDYTIITMVKQGLGVSMLFEGVITGFETGITIKEIEDAPEREVGLIWRNQDTLSIAARTFIDYMKNYFHKMK